MPNLFSGINLALREMLAHQQPNEEIGPDVDFPSAPGPHRQEAEMSAALSSPDPSIHYPDLPAQTGSRVMVDRLQRFNLEFFQGRYRFELGEARRWEIQRDTLKQVEDILAETTRDGLIPKLGAFWSGWLALSRDPTNLAQRKDLLEQATGLAEALNQRAKSLLAVQQGLNPAITARIAAINSLGGRVAFLNAEISNLKASGKTPSDLLGERDRLLNRLAEICGANSSLQESGEAVVSIGGHDLLASRKTYVLETRLNMDNRVQAIWQENGQMLHASSGELAGLLAGRDQIIPEALSGLNTLAFQLASQINVIHTRGYDLAGRAGQPFFQPQQAGPFDRQKDQNALNIKLNPALEVDETMIAAASYPGDPCDGSLAAAIANLSKILSVFICDLYI